MSQPTQDVRSGFLAAAAAYTIWGVLPLYLKLVSFAGPWEVLCSRILWTIPAAFVAVQLLFGLLSIAAGILLISQVTLNGRVLEASLLLVAMLIGGGLAYGAAYIGQGIGSEQMYELRSFLDHALD